MKNNFFKNFFNFQENKLNDTIESSAEDPNINLDEDAYIEDVLYQNLIAYKCDDGAVCR